MPYRIVTVLSLIPLTIAGCTVSTSPETDDTEDPIDSGQPIVECTPVDLSEVEPLVTLDTELQHQGDAPVLIFNFRHSEDPFNLEYVTELNDLTAATMKDISLQFPTLHPVWTIQLQGSDANALIESGDPITQRGISGLHQGAAEGFIRFGYHGQHDPTYNNRPTLDLNKDSTWEQVVEAISTYITCKKNLSFSGDCDAPNGGGIEAILTHFGHVDIVSGLSVPYGAVQFETTGGSHAVKQLLPDRKLGLGFSDHAPGNGNYDDLVLELMTRMTVGSSADPAMLWWDNVLRIHDTDATNMAVGGLKYSKDPGEFLETWQSINRDRPHVLLAHLGDKYSYVVSNQGISPTKHGYQMIQQGLDPRLPEEYLLSQSEREEKHFFSHENLLILSTMLVQDGESRFVDAEALLEQVVPLDYWEISDAETTSMAHWLIQEWSEDGVPPDFVTDGLEYYSLRDALGILMGIQSTSATESTLIDLEGPLSAEASETEGCLPLAELESLSTTIWDGLNADGSTWKSTPSTIVPSTVNTSIGTLNLAQFLQALATARVAQAEGIQGSGVAITAASGAPGTADILAGLEAMNTADTSWSMKPARIRSNVTARP